MPAPFDASKHAFNAKLFSAKLQRKPFVPLFTTTKHGFPEQQHQFEIGVSQCVIIIIIILRNIIDMSRVA